MQFYECLWCGSKFNLAAKKCSNCGAPQLIQHHFPNQSHTVGDNNLIDAVKKIKKLLSLILWLGLSVTIYFLLVKDSTEPLQSAHQPVQQPIETARISIDSHPRSTHSYSRPQDVKHTFGNPVLVDSPDSLTKLLTLTPVRPSPDLANGAEIIVVSGYEPSNVGNNGTKVNVVINRPHSKVLLVLTSYEKISWQVETTPHTQIAGILVSGYKSPSVLTTAQTIGYLTQLPYAYETENAKFKLMLVKLEEMFGTVKVDAFRGNYSIPSLVTISELDSPREELTVQGPAPHPPSANLVFNLIGPDYKFAQWTLSGPVQALEQSFVINGRIALSPAQDFLYKFNDDGIEINHLGRNQPELVSLPPNFPRFSWAMDIAYDSKRNIVAVVTLGGEGYFYRFDAKQKRWLDFRSLNNVDLFSLAYDADSDRYVGWADDGSLIFISGNGDALFSRSLKASLSGFGRLYDSGNERAPRITLAPKGNNIALIHIQGREVSHIWHYEVTSGKTALTFQNDKIYNEPLH